ncbi:MAG TPA: phosphoadenosine phosphosulfate reductase family protein [Brevefilum sp.]|jgi:phosphoadenosine phosphosulfate reductase|nr:phosphoadenosine phosphosulfate reductase family protein [Brevefilum sp.]
MMEAVAHTMHAQTNAYRKRVTQAEIVITAWLEKSQKPYVAFSGGKDSSVMLALVRSIDPEIEAVYCDDQYKFKQTEELLAKTENLRMVANTTTHIEWFTSWEPGYKDDAVEYLGDNHPLWAHRLGYDGACVGIRAEENSYRKIALKSYGQLHYVESKKLWQCYPLAWWTVEDVWAYIHTNGTPYNSAYDVMEAQGITKKRQRIGPLANRRAITQGQAVILKKCFPDAYREFSHDHPEIARYL